MCIHEKIKFQCMGLQWCGSTAISCTSTIPARGWTVCGCAANRKSNRPWAAGCWTTKTVRIRFSLVWSGDQKNEWPHCSPLHSADAFPRILVQTVPAKGIQEAPPPHPNRGDSRTSSHCCTEAAHLCRSDWAAVAGGTKSPFTAGTAGPVGGHDRHSGVQLPTQDIARPGAEEG